MENEVLLVVEEQEKKSRSGAEFLSGGALAPPPSYQYSDHKAPSGLPPLQQASCESGSAAVFRCTGPVPAVMGLLWLLCFISAPETRDASGCATQRESSNSSRRQLDTRQKKKNPENPENNKIKHPRLRL